MSPEQFVFMHIQSTRRFRYYYTSHALILVVHIYLSLHTDTVYGDASVVSNTSGALMLGRIAPLYSYWYAIPSHYYSYVHAVPWVDYCTIVTIHHYRYYADRCSTGEASTVLNTTWYSLLLRLLTILLPLISTPAGA